MPTLVTPWLTAASACSICKSFPDGENVVNEKLYRSPMMKEYFEGKYFNINLETGACNGSITYFDQCHVNAYAVDFSLQLFNVITSKVVKRTFKLSD